MSPLSCSRLVERRRLQQAPFFFLLPLFSLSIRSSKRLKKKNNATMLVECSANNPTDRLTTLSRFEHNLLFLSSAVISRYILNMHIFFDIFFISYYKLLITYSFHKNPIFPSIRTIGRSTNLNGETKRRTRRGGKKHPLSLSLPSSRATTFRYRQRCHDFPRSIFQSLFFFFSSPWHRNGAP